MYMCIYVHTYIYYMTVDIASTVKVFFAGFF